MYLCIAKVVRQRRASTGDLCLYAAGTPNGPIEFEPRAPVYLSTPSPKPWVADDPVHVDGDLLRLREECTLMPDAAVRVNFRLVVMVVVVTI